MEKKVNLLAASDTKGKHIFSYFWKASYNYFSKRLKNSPYDFMHHTYIVNQCRKFVLSINSSKYSSSYFRSWIEEWIYSTIFFCNEDYLYFILGSFFEGTKTCINMWYSHHELVWFAQKKKSIYKSSDSLMNRFTIWNSFN